MVYNFLKSVHAKRFHKHFTKGSNFTKKIIVMSFLKTNVSPRLFEGISKKNLKHFLASKIIFAESNEGGALNITICLQLTPPRSQRLLLISSSSPVKSLPFFAAHGRSFTESTPKSPTSRSSTACSPTSEAKAVFRATNQWKSFKNLLHCVKKM